MGKRLHTNSLLSSILLRARFVKAPRSRFSSTVILVKSPLPSGTREIPRDVTLLARSPLISRERKTTRPLLGLRTPCTVRRDVVFPAPLEPRRTVSSPPSTVKETSQRALVSP